MLQRRPRIQNGKRCGGNGVYTYGSNYYVSSAGSRKIIKAYMMENDVEEKGHFTLDCSKRPYSLSIYVNYELQGQGHSINLLVAFKNFIIGNIVEFENNSQQRKSTKKQRLNQKYLFKFNDDSGNNLLLYDTENIYIDVDASKNVSGKSFWEYIGMNDNQYIEEKYHISKGYEKVIPLQDLLNRIKNIENGRKESNRSKIIKEEST